MREIGEMGMAGARQQGQQDPNGSDQFIGQVFGFIAHHHGYIAHHFSYIDHIWKDIAQAPAFRRYI